MSEKGYIVFNAWVDKKHEEEFLAEMSDPNWYQWKKAKPGKKIAGFHAEGSGWWLEDEMEEFEEKLARFFALYPEAIETTRINVNYTDWDGVEGWECTFAIKKGLVTDYAETKRTWVETEPEFAFDATTPKEEVA